MDWPARQDGGSVMASEAPAADNEDSDRGTVEVEVEEKAEVGGPAEECQDRRPAGGLVLCSAWRDGVLTLGPMQFHSLVGGCYALHCLPQQQPAQEPEAVTRLLADCLAAVDPAEDRPVLRADMASCGPAKHPQLLRLHGLFYSMPTEPLQMNAICCPQAAAPAAPAGGRAVRGDARAVVRGAGVGCGSVE